MGEVNIILAQSNMMIVPALAAKSMIKALGVVKLKMPTEHPNPK